MSTQENRIKLQNADLRSADLRSLRNQEYARLQRKMTLGSVRSVSFTMSEAERDLHYMALDAEVRRARDEMKAAIQ